MADQTLARLVNERRILTQLRQNTAMSRAGLARRLGLTPSTITNVVERLLAEGLVVEVGAPERGPRSLGRPSVGLALNRQGGYFLGVEIGVGVIRLALLDLALQPVDLVSKTVVTDIAPQAVLDIIGGHLRALGRRKVFKNYIRAVCMTVPGLVRSDGHVVHLPILGWRDINLLDMAREQLSIPVLLENNANAAAFGEAYTRPELVTDCVVYLKLGMGCGGAAIVNGRLLRGAGGTATEFGHLRITADGPPCNCGQRGCLETWVNLPALARAYDDSRPWSNEELRALPQQIRDLAAGGSEKARAAAVSIVERLAVGLISLVNSFNPGTVILGGAMSPVLGLDLPALRGLLHDGIVRGMTQPEIILSVLGEFECALGVAAIAHHQAFDVSNIEVMDEGLSRLV